MSRGVRQTSAEIPRAQGNQIDLPVLRISACFLSAATSSSSLTVPASDSAASSISSSRSHADKRRTRTLSLCHPSVAESPFAIRIVNTRYPIECSPRRTTSQPANPYSISRLAAGKSIICLSWSAPGSKIRIRASPGINPRPISRILPRNILKSPASKFSPPMEATSTFPT